jgi:hypothetical protein
MKEQVPAAELLAEGEALEPCEQQKKPYEAPRLSSGDVFERIVVASAPTEGEFVC